MALWSCSEVKSFCDPNGKDLDDYRRHQRMVQVRQEFHHYGTSDVLNRRALGRHAMFPEGSPRPSLAIHDHFAHGRYNRYI